MSSTVSWSRAAQRVSVSSRSPAQIFATSTGWVMKSSPERRRWSAWRSQANANACSTARRSSSEVPLVGVLGDDGEQVAEERPLVVGQILRVLVVRDLDGRGVLVRADARVPAGLGSQHERLVGDEVAVLPVAVYAAAGIGLELCSLTLVRNCKHSS